MSLCGLCRIQLNSVYCLIITNLPSTLLFILISAVLSKFSELSWAILSIRFPCSLVWWYCRHFSDMFNYCKFNKVNNLHDVFKACSLIFSTTKAFESVNEYLKLVLLSPFFKNYVIKLIMNCTCIIDDKYLFSPHLRALIRTTHPETRGWGVGLIPNNDELFQNT